MDVRNLLSGVKRSDTTVTQYISILNRLHRMVTDSEDEFSDLNWLLDVETVMAALSHYKPPSRKLYIVPVIVLLKGSGDTELLTNYSEELEKCAKEISESENLAQSKTERELKNWITFNDVRDKIKQLQRIIKKKIVDKKIEDIGVEDRKVITHHLILSLYSKMNPLRNDYADVKIIPYGREQTDSEKSMNVLDEEAPGCYTLLLRHYKTHKAYGDQTHVFPKPLNKIVSDSLRLFPRAYLLSNLKDGDIPMTPAYLSQTSSQIFASENKRVGSWMLRKIFLSELYKDDTPLQKRKATAASMGHSAEIAERVYRRV
jgi:hypothetical protein